MTDNLSWLKSSYSAQGNACIEVATLPDGTRLVRDSKDVEGPTLRLSAEAWGRFTGALKH
jgi:hypothetical protein